MTTPTHATSGRPNPFRLATILALVLILSAQFAAGATARDSDRVANPMRLQDTVELSLMTTVRSQEVGPPPGDWFLVQAIRDELNIDLQINWVTAPSEYDSRLQTLAGANDLPDVFTTPPDIMSNLVNQGLVADWEPYVATMPTYATNYRVNELAQIGTFDGTHYGLVRSTTDPFKTVVSIRQDWLDRLGLAVPTTTEEYFAVMQAFTTQDPDGNGQNDTYGWTSSVNSDGEFSNFDPILAAFGALGDWAVVDNQLVPMSTTENRRQALEFIARMQAAGVIDPDWTAQTGEDRLSKWKAGRIGIFQEDWCANYCYQGYSQFAAANPTGVLKIINPPIGPTGLSASGGYNAAGTMYGLSQQAADAGKGEAAARLFEWFATGGYERTAFGLEGTNYQKNPDGTITQDTSLESVQNRQLCPFAYVGSDTEFNARYAEVTQHTNGQTVNVPEILAQAQQLPKVDLTQFAPLPPPPAEISADFTRLRAEGEFAFANGQRSFEEWGSYVEELNGVGLPTWVEAASERAREIGLIS